MHTIMWSLFNLELMQVYIATLDARCVRLVCEKNSENEEKRRKKKLYDSRQSLIAGRLLCLIAGHSVAATRQQRTVAFHGQVNKATT